MTDKSQNDIGAGLMHEQGKTEAEAERYLASRRKAIIVMGILGGMILGHLKISFAAGLVLGLIAGLTSWPFTPSVALAALVGVIGAIVGAIVGYKMALRYAEREIR